MRRILIRFLGVALLFSGVPVSPTAFAQNGQTLTLEECVRMAMRNNSELKRAALQVDRAGASVKGSYSGVLPRINTTFQSGRTIRGERLDRVDVPKIDPETGEVIVDREDTRSPERTFDAHSLTLSYNHTLFDFGRSWNVIKQAKSSFEASSANLAAVRQNVYATVQQRYLELLKAMKLVQELELAVERSREQLERVRTMHEIGSVAQIDVYRAEVNLANDEISLINQQNALEIAKGNLNLTLGRDPDMPINIADAEVEVQAPQISLEAAIATAEANNPELLRYEYEMASAEYGRKVAKGRYWPSIGIGITYRRDNSLFDRVYGSLGQNFTVTLGAQMNLNVFNGLSDLAEVERQSANYAIAEETRLAQERAIELEVKQAYLNLNRALRISEINQRNLRAAEEEYRLAQERYRVGAGTQLEVTEAQVSLTRARVQLVRAKYDAMIARAQLDAAMGVAETPGVRSNE